MTLHKFLFRYRSYTPIPFLIAMIIWARPTGVSFFCGFFVLLLGELLRLWGVSYAGSETRTTGNVGASKLVISGPFAHVRNPLYVGNMLMYLGTGIISNALFPYLIAIAFVYFVFQYVMIIHEEEDFLLKEFGEEYKKYCEHVPRFIPKLHPYQSNNPMKVNWKSGLRSESRTFQAIVSVVILIVVRWIFL